MAECTLSLPFHAENSCRFRWGRLLALLSFPLEWSSLCLITNFCARSETSRTCRIFKKLGIAVQLSYNKFTSQVNRGWGVGLLQIEYNNRALEKVCTDAQEARKKYGQKMAEKIQQRIGEISAAPSVETLVQFKIGRCHALGGNRNGQYAMDLVHPYRLVFKKNGADIQIVKILEIVDYH